jgi:formylmethanofuran dehydrogenase subunit B
MSEHDSRQSLLSRPLACLVCGCLCDDLMAESEDGRITGIRNACRLGSDWLLQERVEPTSSPGTTLEGKPAEPGVALARAVEMLVTARSPVVLGSGFSTNETVAAALAIAERIGALVEFGDTRQSLPRLLAFQRAGRVSATLGEVRNRADVVVFWGANPLVTHPRHWERYSVEPEGRFIPAGRSGRTVIVVDTEKTESAEQADAFFQIREDSQFETLWMLRALVKGIEPVDPAWVLRSTGRALDQLGVLAGYLRKARYGAWFCGPRMNAGSLSRASATHEAAACLVRDLNRGSRFVILGMGEPGNIPGAEAVSTWQTGFSTSVDLVAGYPQSLPGAAANDRLLRGEADLALVVGDRHRREQDSPVSAALNQIPQVIINSQREEHGASETNRVWLRAALPGLEENGTIMRSDGVALPLRAIRSTTDWTEERWLKEMLVRIDTYRSQSNIDSNVSAS